MIQSVFLLELCWILILLLVYFGFTFYLLSREVAALQYLP